MKLITGETENFSEAFLLFDSYLGWREIRTELKFLFYNVIAWSRRPYKHLTYALSS